MRSIATTVSFVVLAAFLAPAAHAQTSKFELRPQLTQEEFKEFAADLGSMLRFRQPGDAPTLGRGNVDLSVELANTPTTQSSRAWNNTMTAPAAGHRLGPNMSFPRIVARVGVNDRMDIGAWGGLNPNGNYGLVGVDTKIALVREGRSSPVSISVRPSITSLVGPSDVWAGNVSVDLAVSRAFGRLVPYGGIAASSSAAIERSAALDLDPATAGETSAYGGVAYRWRSLLVSGDVEKGNQTTYAIRVGTRF